VKREHDRRRATEELFSSVEGGKKRGKNGKRSRADGKIVLNGFMYFSILRFAFPRRLAESLVLVEMKNEILFAACQGWRRTRTLVEALSVLQP
jgi:hypothetical protein